MSKLIKSALKSVKSSIQSKDYETALKHSQSALDLDANNYLGLFFSGFCLAELKRQNEALERYKSALTVDGNHSQTHQGVVKLFTKQWTGVLSDENLQNLINSYEELLKNCPKGDNEEKRVEYICGICTTMRKQTGNMKQSLNLLKNEYVDFPHNIQLKLEILKSFVEGENKIEFSDNKWILTPLKDICLTDVGFDAKHQEEAFQVLLNIYKKDNLLRNGSEMENFIQICLKLFNNFQIVRDVSLEILLQKSDCGIEWWMFDEYCGKYKQVVDSHQLIEEGKLQEAVYNMKKLTSSTSSSCNFISLWVMLSDLHLKLNQHPQAEQVARVGLQIYKRLINGEIPSFISILSLDDIKLDLTYNLAVSLSGLENNKSKEMAVTTFEMMLKSDNNDRYMELIYIKLVETLIELNKLEQAQLYLNKIFDDIDGGSSDDIHLNCLRIQLLFLEGKKEIALEEIEILSKTDNQSYFVHFLHGQFMWMMDDKYRKDKQKCLNSFLKAAKLNVSHGQTFLYLGHYYNMIANDKLKALKLYQKSYDLSPGCPETGVALADVFIALGKVDLAIQLYEKITANSATGTCKWAWFRLGLCHLKNHEGDPAIKCFQSALRADPNDHICWECLGEGYVERGSYPSAWKAFERARQLNPNSVFAVYQKAVVNQLMYLFHDAVTEFEESLKIRPRYVPALKGLAESHLSIARQMLQQGRDKTCIYHINLSIQHLTIALEENCNLSCLWRLLADGCSLVEMLNLSIVQLNISYGLTTTNKEDGGDKDGQQIITIGKIQALELSNSYYLRALALCGNNNAVLMNDYGFSYYRLAWIETDEIKARNIANKALQILKKASGIDPHNHLIWNNIGLVASSRFCEDKRLAQHSFIKSIQCEGNNWISWCNLGVLYLISSNAILANKAFKTAQNLQPSYINSWIGQALIAENVESKEAMDLFRHSTELSYHDEAIAGYTWWVCHTIAKCTNRQKSAHYKESIGDMKAIISAIPYIRIYCKRHPYCCASWTTLGFLLEQDKLYLESEKCYEEAYKTADTTNQTNYINIIINYARLLSLNCKHDEALKIIGEISHHNSTLEFGQICGIAFIYTRASCSEEATKYYTKAIELAPTEKELKECQLALALHLWKCGEINQAKELFQQIEAYEWLCAIAILDKNRDEMESLCWMLTNNEDGNKSYFQQLVEIYVVEILNNPSSAIQLLQQFIQRSPESWKLRHLLSRISCGVIESREHTSSTCDVIDIFTKSLTSPINHHMTDTTLMENLYHDFNVNLSNCLSYIESNYHCRNSTNNRLKEAQRLVHRHPYFTKSWITVGVAVQADNIIHKITNGTTDKKMDVCINKIFTHIATNVDDANMKEWISSNQFIHCLISGNHTDVHQLLEKLPHDKRELFTLWLKCVEKDTNVEIVEKLQIIGQVDEYQKIVVGILQHISKWEESFEILTTTSSSSDWMKIVKLTLDAAIESGDDKLWITDRGMNACENLPNNLHLSHLLDGLVKRKSGNYRKSRYLFNKIFKPLTEEDEKVEDGEKVEDDGGESMVDDKNMKVDGDNVADGDNVGYIEPVLKLATWYLYRGYVEKKDPVELEKLCEKWKKFDEKSFKKISQILYLS